MRKILSILVVSAAFISGCKKNDNSQYLISDPDNRLPVTVKLIDFRNRLPISNTMIHFLTKTVNGSEIRERVVSDKDGLVTVFRDRDAVVFLKCADNDLFGYFTVNSYNRDVEDENGQSWKVATLDSALSTTANPVWKVIVYGKSSLIVQCSGSMIPPSIPAYGAEMKISGKDPQSGVLIFSKMVYEGDDFYGSELEPFSRILDVPGDLIYEVNFRLFSGMGTLLKDSSISKYVPAASTQSIVWEY